MKTVIQDIAVGWALLPLTADKHRWLANGFLWFAVVLTVVTGLQYLLDGRKAAASAL